ncbi:MAG: hypothetical protein NVS2B8_07160 [Vulcanimicrobiaceae bacterium]
MLGGFVKRWPMWLLLCAGVLGVLTLAVVLLHGPLIATGIGTAARLAGYDVRYDSLRLSPGHVTIGHPDVSSLGGEPVFTAKSLEIAYDTRTLGRGPHFFGISGIELERPKLTIVHHRDGSYNVRLPKSQPGAKAAPFVFPQIHAVVHDGSIGVLDDTRLFRHSRRFALQNVQLDADVDPHALSQFTFTTTLVEDGGAFPIAGRGRFDPARGYELAHVRARTLALAPLLDYALNSTSLHIANGILNDVDARVYGLKDRSGTIARHVAVTANLDHFQPYLNGLAKPLRDGRGSIRIYDSGLAIPRVDGSIAGVPVRIAGAIYDLGHPTLRLGITGRGDVARLLTLAQAQRPLPIRGPLAFKLFVEGDATAPQTLASFRSPGIVYDRYAISSPSGLVALNGAETAIVRSSLQYVGLDVGARGRLLSHGTHTNIELVADVAGPASRLPYASIVAPDLPLSAVAVIRGVDARLAVAGTVVGDTARERLAGTFALDGSGVGTVGPLALQGPGDREAVAYVVLDRPGFRSGAAFVSARNLVFSTAGARPSIPGLDLPTLPRADGTLDANVAIALDGTRFVAGGDARLANAHALGYAIEELHARARTTERGDVAVDARYRGPLAAFAGAARGVAVRGRADVPLSIVASNAGTLVSIADARFAGASVGGVALSALSATVGVRAHGYDIYAARATLDGNDVVARGSFGDGGTVAVSASDVDLAALRGLGLPVRAGAVTALAEIGGSTNAPQATGGIAVAGIPLPGTFAPGLALEGNAEVAYAGDRLTLHDGLVRTGNTVAAIDGHVAGLGDARTATYDVGARVRQADIATLARAARSPLQYPEGSLDADVRVRGTGHAPSVIGRVAIPEGSLNGLRFHGASVALAGTGGTVRARDGRVTVGSSVLSFDGAYSAAARDVAFRASHVDLADFDDYFDRGDTLGGRGSFAVSARVEPNRFTTGGRVRLAHARLRRFEIGDARAEWSTSDRTVAFDAALGGAPGRITTSGTLGLAATAPLRDALHRTDLGVALHARGVDLGVWLPAVDVHVPVLGAVDADVRARGTYPDIALATNASLANGLIGRVPIRVATLAARGTHGRATITSAVLAVDNLHVEARGDVGLHPGDPLDLRALAQSADIGALAQTFSGKRYDSSGSLTANVRVRGTVAKPLADATLDGTTLRYATYTLPRAHVEANLGASRLTVGNAEIDFTQGRLLAHGFVPVDRAAGLRLIPTAPGGLDLVADRIALGQFASLFPRGTSATGTLDGRVSASGTLANPQLGGTLAFADGSFVGPQLRSKLGDARAELTFAGSSATLHDAHATLGGGALDADGSATLPTLRAPARDLAYALHLTSRNAFVDAPQYLRGRIDGTVALTRAADRAPLLAGRVALAQTRVPLNAIFNPNAPTSTATASPLALALDLAVDVGRDVRVQGGPADLGAQGHLRVGGTLVAPTASGELESTGGTIGFYRTFRLQYPSTVAFEASNGIVPLVDATATTTVDNPPTDVTLHLTGLATQLNVALASDPNYSREQILGLLVGAQALGAVSGVRTVAGSGPQINPFQAAAQGQLGTLLTRNIFEPLSSQIGCAIGLTNLAINYSPGGSFDIGAQKRIFKNVTAVFAQSFNYPPRESLGLRASPNDATALQLTFFSQPSSNRFDTFSGNQALLSTNQSVTSTQPATGTSGFSISLQRRY